jgi:SAM-dependent methyltransferase
LSGQNQTHHPGAGAFDQYAAWYNAFNRDKDYAAEARYVLEKVRLWQPTPRCWVDIGCGVGNHLAFLQSQGISVEGLDTSRAMIAQARIGHPTIPFRVATAQSFHLQGERDVISMLFHVLSYQTAESAVARALENVAAHLAAPGVLVFDFWHTGGVLRDPPSVRVREARVGNRQLFRIARPTEDGNRRRVDIRFEFRWDAPDGPVAHEEDHSLRHFTEDELAAFLERAGLDVLTCEGWMRDRALRPEDWYGLICARKRDRS